MTIKIALGSQNAAKVAAVENAAKICLDETVVVAGIAAESGVSDMPTSHDEAITGARNRAKVALESGAEYGVGIEANTHEYEQFMQMSAWVVVIHKDGQESIGQAAGLPMPDHWRSEIRNGAEIRPLMLETGLPYDYTTGASGFLTNGGLPRNEQLQQAVVAALAPFANKQAYKDFPTKTEAA